MALSSVLGTSFPDNLIGGDFPINTIDIVLEQNQSILRGDILGKKTPTVPTTGTADGGNTGDGLLTAVTAGRDVKDGIYTVTITVAATDGGSFSVVNGNGTILPPGTVGVAYVSDEINFLLSDGAADFIVGDLFTITVVEGARMCKIINSANSDGSETPFCIASETIDTTATGTNADTVSVGYLTGQFNERSLRVGGTDTVAQYRDACRALSIFFVDSVAAGDLEGNGN